MSAGLMEYDWMLSVKEKPWHGIGTVVEKAPTSDKAIKIAKLNWKVEQVPIMANGVEIPNYYANVRSDTGEALGVVKGRYKIIQNTEAFDFVDDIVSNKENECRYETAGSLFNGKRIFLLVKLPNTELLGDDIENYLFFTNSHDGSSSLTAGISNIRVVCNNTLQMAIKGAKRTWTCRHTDSIFSKKEQAKEALGFAVAYVDSMEETAKKLALKKINEEKFFRKLFEINPTNLHGKNQEQAIERMHLIFNEKDDLQNFRGSAWGMYNAVSDFISNTTPFRNTSTHKETKMNNFCKGYILLDTAQQLLMAA